MDRAGDAVWNGRGFEKLVGTDCLGRNLEDCFRQWGALKLDGLSGWDTLHGNGGLGVGSEVVEEVIGEQLGLTPGASLGRAISAVEASSSIRLSTSTTLLLGAVLNCKVSF